MENIFYIVMAMAWTCSQLLRLKNIMKGTECVKIYFLIPLVLIALIIFIWLCFEIWSGSIPLYILCISYCLIMLAITEIIGYIKQSDKINN